jgi:hypothetical protein
MPVFIAKYNEHKQQLGSTIAGVDDLLGTIRVPKNLSLLGDRLPAAQYDQINVDNDEFEKIINDYAP